MRFEDAFLDELGKIAGLPAAVKAGGGGPVGEAMRQRHRFGKERIGPFLGEAKKSDPSLYKETLAGLPRFGLRGLVSKAEGRERNVRVPTKPTHPDVIVSDPEGPYGAEHRMRVIRNKRNVMARKWGGIKQEPKRKTLSVREFQQALKKT